MGFSPNMAQSLDFSTLCGHISHLLAQIVFLPAFQATVLTCTRYPQVLSFFRRELVSAGAALLALLGLLTARALTPVSAAAAAALLVSAAATAALLMVSATAAVCVSDFPIDTFCEWDLIDLLLSKASHGYP